MKKEEWFWIGLVFVCFANFVPVFPDPFYHTERVTLFEWVRREIYELLYGEK